MSHTSEQIDCDNCVTMTITKFRKVKLTRLGKPHIFEDVETKTCPNCDNFYLSDVTLKKCDELLKKELVAA
jgi:hypothetical protein